MKLFFKALICLLISSFACAFSADLSQNADTLSYVICHPQLRPVLDKIQQIPEAQALIREIQKEGIIRITVDDHPICKQFGAFWDLDRRTIAVYLDYYQDEGDAIGSILFELQNAQSTSVYDRLDQLAANRQITREKYIESVEYQEYKNSKGAALIAEKGIRAGLFPASARLMTYSSFEEHYHYQKIGGHSQLIGRNYDQLVHSSR